MTDDKKENSNLLLQAEVMERLRCSLSTVKRLQRTGELSFFKLGNKIRTFDESVTAYIERNTHRSKYKEKPLPGSPKAERAEDEKIAAMARRDHLKYRLRQQLKTFKAK